jgi:hypothetical protein
VLAGVKYYFTPQLYGSAQLGTGIFTADVESTLTFAYAPVIGCKFSENFDAVLKYQAYSTDSIKNSTGGIRNTYTF